MSVAYDVAIVGTGTMGAMAAWQLARRGVRVIAFEQFAPAHDRGAHGGESRIFRTAYFEDPGYVPILLEAQRQWRELEAASGRELLRLTGGLTIGRRGTPFVANVLESCETYGLAHEVLTSDEAARRWPQHQLSDDDLVVLDAQAGFLRPEAAVLAASQLAVDTGAAILEHCRVEAIAPAGGAVEIEAGGNRYRAGQVIVTGGAWASTLLPQLRPLIEPRRIVATWWPARDPAAFMPERFPIFIREEGEVHASGIPTIDGVGVKVGMAVHGQGHAPDQLDRNVSPADLRPIADVVHRWFPGLHPEPSRIGAYQDGYTRDHHAILGRGSQPEMIFACGFSGHGFKMAPAIGGILADLVTKERTELPIAHLAPGRLGL